MKIKILFVTCVIFLFIGTLHNSNVYGCYAIVAGKDATQDGSVLIAHSELNKPDKCFLNFRKIPRMEHPENGMIQLQYGGTYPDVKESYAYLWSENMGMEGSDAVINEWGVSCVSDGTPSRERSMEDLKEAGQIEDGGIGFRLRIEVARRAKTAREGVKIVGELVEKFGSRHAINFVIADPNEAWIVALPKGKQWVAQRVPDDEVVVLPNVNIIQEVDLADTANFLGSENLIQYATKKGWHNPDEESFNYKRAYGKPKWTGWFEDKYDCDPRQWRGQWLVTGNRPQLPPEGFLPFSVKPDQKLDVPKLREIMSDHMEETKFDKTEGYKNGSPHDMMGPRNGAICDERNQEVGIFQLRSWLPPAIGCVYWRSTAAICSSVLTPWYVGVKSVPSAYHVDIPPEKNVKTDYHFNPPEKVFEYDESKAFWLYNALENLVDIDYKNNIENVQPVWKEFEKEEYKLQPVIEDKALQLYREDPELCATYLTHYSRGMALEALEETKKLVNMLREKHFGY
ncbi:MAG: dipeptidase [Bacteroidales bacterium]